MSAARIAQERAPRGDRRPALVLLPVLLCTLGLLYTAALHTHQAAHHRTPAAIAVAALADTHASTVRGDHDAHAAPTAATPAAAGYFGRVDEPPIAVAVAARAPARPRGPPVAVS